MDYFRNCCSLLANALLPQRCALCDASTDSAAPLCAPCTGRLPRLPDDHCPRCADFSAAAVLCGRCIADAPSFDRVLAPFLYAEPLDQLIQALKYEHQLRLARWFGQQMLITMAARHQLGDGINNIEAIDAIVPLPLHPARMNSRGFNQALEISRPIAAGLRKPLLRWSAIRSRDTAPQASLPRAERQSNILGAFECREDFSARTLLVIDDVLTTGSSASELARVLKLHGARRVIVATVARTHHH